VLPFRRCRRRMEPSPYRASWTLAFRTVRRHSSKSDDELHAHKSSKHGQMIGAEWYRAGSRAGLGTRPACASVANLLALMVAARVSLAAFLCTVKVYLSTWSLFLKPGSPKPVELATQLNHQRFVDHAPSTHADANTHLFAWRARTLVAHARATVLATA
jgi:hypothetical protein